ncbi:anti-sigma factor [Erythrobacter sp. EC-HK427]|uniref:anti-sigma factor n=1 Tax=Erythrobacter sp. EC-HK427 TaxID=2038396 RepID=UPI00125B3EDF|nr:anti-sigma factor [Erythrobacter sp. EC-HK427]VVS98310.1 conserved hypothetical protein [Erythrobacter sp. EC-HK427]
MTTKAASLPPRETLAAEFVLGLAEGEELLRARAMLARDPDFADAVARWEEHFAPLLDTLDEAAPAPEVWARIAAATVAAPDDAPVATAEIVALKTSRDRWRWFGGLSAAAAAVLAIVVMTGPVREAGSPVAPAPAESALLAANIPIADTGLRLALTYVPDRDVMTVSSAGLTADGVHDHELWLVDRAGELHSLGVIVPGEEARVAVAPELAGEFVEGSRLLLTREPLGGKPEGVDAGPVVAEGAFRAI